MAKHWIFDLDGTLIDSHPLYIDVFREVSEHFQLKLTSEAWDELCHLVLPKFLDKYFPAKDVESAFNMVIQRNMERHDEIEVYAGVREILDHLKTAGCTLSLCTARERKTAEGILKTKALGRYFDQFVTRDCVAKTKPHPEGIQRLITSSGVAAADTLMVGDHRMDIEAARGAGILAVSVGWNRFAQENLAGHSDHHFIDVADLHRWAGMTVGAHKISMALGDVKADDGVP